MTIKTKIALNASLVILIVLTLSAVSIYGLTSVRRNLSYLLATSTPYQVRTTDLQRTLQGAVSYLINSSGATSARELKLFQESFVKSQAELKSAEEALERVSGRSQGIYKELNGTSAEVFGITEKRLQSEAAVQEAYKAIGARLKEMTVALGQLDSKVASLQKTNTQAFKSAFDSSKKLAQHLKNVESGKSSLESLQMQLSTLQSARERKQAIILKSKISGQLDQLAENQAVVESKEMIASIRSVKQKTTELADAHATYLKQPEESAGKQKLDTLVSELKEQLGTVQTTLAQNADAANMEATTATKRQDSSFTQTNAASGVLSSNATLVASVLSLDGLSARLFIASSEAELDRIQEEINTVFAKMPGYKNTLEKGMAAINAKAETALLNSAVSKLNGVREILLAKDGAISKVRLQLEMLRKGKELDDRLRKMVVSYTEEGKKELLTAHKGQEDAAASANRTVRFSISLNIIVGAISIIASLLLGFMLYRSIVRPVVRVKGVIEEAEQTNSLTARLDHLNSDEIGDMAQSYNRFLDRLHQAISQINEIAAKVADSSRDISVSSHQMAASAKKQAEQTAGIATATEEMSATVQDVTSNTHSVADFSTSLKTSVLDGGEVIRQAIKGIKSVAKTLDEASGTISDLSQQSARIGEVASVINDIAEQTNLLALNAAIEAARAGEQGRGFAVVADEVKKLAERTTQATGEIAGMISSIQKESENVASSMKRGMKEAETGVVLANSAGEALEKIVSGIEEIAGMISQIATASQEQSSTIEMIAENILQVSGVTNGFAVGMNRSADSSEKLDLLAKQMSQLVGQFKV
jgi:methyl-accepting chemotaxis protein